MEDAMEPSKIRYIVDDKGKRTEVVLPVEEYEEILEDLHDLAVIAERRDEPTLSFEELKQKLKADGLL
jgi:hypothetical protein